MQDFTEVKWLHNQRKSAESEVQKSRIFPHQNPLELL